MRATTAPVRVDEVPDLDPERVAQYLRDATIIQGIEPLDQLGDDHPACLAWDRLSDEVTREIAPAVARLYMEALRRRLPWTWEG